MNEINDSILLDTTRKILNFSSEKTVADKLDDLDAPDWAMETIEKVLKDNNEPDYMFFYFLTASLPQEAFENNDSLDLFLSCWLAIQKEQGNINEYLRVKLTLMYQKRYHDAWGIKTV